MPVTKNSPVFVGENLGQLITPTAPDHQCRHWRSIPGGITNSYLVASVATINLISSRNKDNEDQFDFGDHVWEYKDQFLFTVCHDRCKKAAQKTKQIFGHRNQATNPGLELPEKRVCGVCGEMKRQGTSTSTKWTSCPVD
jgi:hypothetical protein